MKNLSFGSLEKSWLRGPVRWRTCTLNDGHIRALKVMSTTLISATAYAVHLHSLPNLQITRSWTVGAAATCSMDVHDTVVAVGTADGVVSTWNWSMDSTSSIAQSTSAGASTANSIGVDSSGTVVLAGHSGQLHRWDIHTNCLSLLGSLDSPIWQVIYRKPLTVSVAYNGNISCMTAVFPSYLFAV
jgi:hypothetical protein